MFGGRDPLVRNGATEGRNRDWRVFFILCGPEGAVTVGYDGCEGSKDRARYCVDKRFKCPLTGRTDASA